MSRAEPTNTGEPVAWERRWSRLNETKTANYTPKGWTLFPVTQAKLLPDDFPLYAQPQPSQQAGTEGVTVDALAQEIRRVDGNHDLGAGALADALMPFLAALQPQPSQQAGTEVSADDLARACAAVADGLVCEGPEHRLIHERDKYSLRRIATDSNLARAILAALKPVET